MAGEALRAYLVELAEYALGNVRGLLPAGVRPPRREFSTDDEWEQQTVTEWAGWVVNHLPPALAEHVWAGVDEEEVRRAIAAGNLTAVRGHVRRALTDDEYTRLASAFGNLPIRLDRHAVWEPDERMHRWHVRCLLEIRRELSGAAAEEWAEDSAGFAATLCANRVSLSDGLKVVGDWAWRAQELLEVIDPTPPAAQDQGGVGRDVTQDPRFQDTREQIRAMIGESAGGRQMTRKAIVGRLRLRRQHVLDVLRWMAAHGEYDGVG